jgi:hypothetical protein
MSSSEQNPGRDSASEPTWIELTQQLMENRAFQVCALLSGLVLGIAGLFATELTTNARVLIALCVAFVLWAFLPSPLKKRLWKVGGNIGTFIIVCVVGGVMFVLPLYVLGLLSYVVTGSSDINYWIRTLPPFISEVVDLIAPLITIGFIILFWIAVFHIYHFAKRGWSD